ncbi:hypothetical protein N7457_003319 [Penicillium paradoxum]|uniref:uncharacterized protein n=1 Tax=Penicillium paradoxum TaxID=176176 RepID=UPI0025486FC0|nr:uncharacterized protein N7457_003319 [Penicillium paradoxum]KAJ5788329.1 hypothetical protein N7457_003319 [Penicillium paradoxum]
MATNSSNNNDYARIPTIIWQIRTLRNNHELDGIAIWNAILTLRFPPAQGFIHPQIHNIWHGDPDSFTLELTHLRYGQQNPVLALYYRSVNRRDDNQWDYAQRALEMYLSARFGDLAEYAFPVYGILAIGVKVKVFTYDGPSRSIEPFVPPWDLERHHQLVWDMLGMIAGIHTGGISEMGGGVDVLGGEDKKDE